MANTDPADSPPLKRTKAESNGRFMLGIALVCFGISTYGFFETLIFLWGSQSATGTIVSVRSIARHNKQGDSLAYQPTVRFKDSEGQLQETEAMAASKSPPTIGGTVTVIYHLRDPGRGRIESELWDWPAGLFVFGIFWAVVGVILIAIGRTLPRWGLPLRLTS